MCLFYACNQMCETQKSGGWFNINMPSYQYRISHLEKRLISTMVFAILVRWQLYIESGPWLCWKALHLLTPQIHIMKRGNPYWLSRKSLFWWNMHLLSIRLLLQTYSPKTKVVMVPNLSLLVALHFIVMTTCSVTSDEKLGIMTTLGVQC